MDRIRPREIQQDPDIPLINSFAGLASASYNTTGDIIYMDKMTNLFVNKSGGLQQRGGSVCIAAASWFDNSDGYGVYRFKFDGIFYLLIKLSTQLSLLGSTDNLNYFVCCTKSNVFNNTAALDKPTFATKIEGNTCHVLVATTNNQLVSFTILKRQFAATIAGTTISGTLPIPINGSVITSNQCLLKTPNGTIIPTGVIHSGAAWSCVNAGAPLIPNGSIVTLHAFFWVRFADSMYFPGLYLANSAIRRNSLPLDVNVAVPLDLASNAIINEPLQDVANQTLYVYAAGVQQTKVTNRTPATNTEWDFSDGSYYTGAGLLTNPSPSFISFGGLVGSNNTTVSLVRLRRMLMQGATVANLIAYVDKTVKTAVYHNTATAVIATGVPTYFSFATSNVNLNLSSVVELIDLTNYSGSAGTTAVADLDESNSSVTINNGSVMPLYGYNYFISASRTFPNIVTIVGNRLILAGTETRIGFSNSDWNYRGITFNNLQLSTIDFSPNSAFAITLTQGSSEVRGVTSVNGVTVVASDIGVFRIAGANANQPPQADTATVSRVSNEIVPNNNCFALFDNKVYYASLNGLFALEYSDQTTELSNSSLSSVVSNKFPFVNALTYSEQLRSFVMGFSTSNELLTLNLDSETWATIEFATSAVPSIDRGNDGFYFVFAVGSTRHLLCCQWDVSRTVDCANLFPSFPVALPGRSVTLTAVPSSVDSLVCPAELLASLSAANIVPSYGDNSARLVGAASVTITEHEPFVATSLPINGYFVTKAFYSDKIDRANRVRSISLIVKGSGTILTRIGNLGNDYADRASNEVTVWNIVTNVYQGEPLLNAQLPQYEIRGSEGNTVNFKLRTTGISEQWNFAGRLSSGLTLAGLQFDTSTKSRKRLR